jgi:hypothetical protein
MHEEPLMRWAGFSAGFAQGIKLANFPQLRSLSDYPQ